MTLQLKDNPHQFKSYAYAITSVQAISCETRDTVLCISVHWPKHDACSIYSLFS